MATRAERRQVTQNRLKAMQHPLRAEVFRLFRESAGPMSPAEAARELEADIPTVSYHVRKLSEYDCVEEVENRPVRGVVEHFYRATERQRLDLEEWAELSDAEPEVAEVLTDEFMQSIVDDFTASRRASIVGRDEKFAITRHPLLLDDEGLDEAIEAALAYEAKMTDIAARSAARLSADDPGIPVSSSIVLFKMPPRRQRPR